MIELLRAGGNPHKVACEIFFGSKYTEEKDEKIKKTIYNKMKNGHFAMAYGAGLDKIAETLGLTYEEAYLGHAAYVERFPKVASLSRDTAILARHNGYVTTPFGRRLYIQRDKAYSAINYLIQGTGSNMLKRAEIRVAEYCHAVWGDKIKIIMPIHDELIFEVDRSILGLESDYISQLSRLMTDFKDYLKVPIEVEWKRTTTTWQKAKPLIIENVKEVK